MLFVKTLIRALATSLCLLLVAASPGVAGEASFESLPVGAKTRLGRGWITDAQYSPDGTRLAIGSSVGIWLYDTQTYEVASLLTGHAYGVAGLAFSPNGRTLAGAGRDDTIRLWNPDTGTLRHILEGPSRSISGSDTSLAFSPDGRTLASARRSNTVHLWDTAEGTLRRTLKVKEYSGPITSLAFSPDGRTLAIGTTGEGGPVQLWDVTSTVQSWAVNTDTLLHILESHTDEISSVAFSPDGRTLASGGRNSPLQLWDPDTGTLRHTLEGHSRGIGSLAFSPDGRTLASNWGNTVHLRDADTGTLRHTLEGHSRGIGSLAFSPDGRTLASASLDNTVHLWDTATYTLRHTLEGYMAPVRSLAFSPDSRLLASGGTDNVYTRGDADNFVRLWDTATYTLRHTLPGHKFKIDNLAFSSDGRTLASGGWDSGGKLRMRDTVRLWDVATGSLRHMLADYVGGVWDVAFSPDGRTLASAGRGPVARLFDATTGSLRHTLVDDIYVFNVAFSPDGRTLATGSKYTLKLWDAEAGILRHTLWTGEVTSLAFSPDGRTLASGSTDGIRLLDAATGSLQHSLDDGSVVWDVAFSPDSRTLASVGKDHTVRLWDADTGTLRHTLAGHADSVNFVAFSPDGRTLASGSADDLTIRLWDVATGSLRHLLEGHTNRINGLLFSPDGRTLASGSTDGTILLWDVVSEAAAGDFHNLETNPNGHWAVWQSGTTTTVRFGSPRAPVQYHARQDPQPQFVLPEGFRPATRVTHTVTGTQVHADGTPVPHAPPATFDLTIDPNGEVRYVDNPKVDGLGYVNYRVTRLTWPTREPPSSFGTEEPPTVGSDASN